jgi:hypothetical protein
MNPGLLIFLITAGVLGFFMIMYNAAQPVKYGGKRKIAYLK